MPRGKRGGARTGSPQTAYANRTDLNQPAPVLAFRGQQYGQGVAQQAQQQQSNAAAAAISAQAPAASPPVQPVPGPTPGSLGSLLDPTARPDEPLTAGAPFGPGPSQGTMMPSPDDQAIDRLRIVYRQTGLASLGRLIEQYEDQ